MWVLHVFVSLISEEVSEGKADLHVSEQYDSLLGSQGALRSPKHQQGCQGWGKLETAQLPPQTCYTLFLSCPVS